MKFGAAIRWIIDERSTEIILAGTFVPCAEGDVSNGTDEFL